MYNTLYTAVICCSVLSHMQESESIAGAEVVPGVAAGQNVPLFGVPSLN